MNHTHYYLSMAGSVEPAHLFYENGFGARSMFRRTLSGVWPLHWTYSKLTFDDVVFLHLFDSMLVDEYPQFDPNVNLVLTRRDVTEFFHRAARGGFLDGNLRYAANGSQRATILDPFGYLWTITEDVEVVEPSADDDPADNGASPPAVSSSASSSTFIV